MSSYSTSSGSSYARTLDTLCTSDERASPILPHSGVIYISKEEAMNASSSELESERERRWGTSSNGQPTSNADESSTHKDVEYSASDARYSEEVSQQSHAINNTSRLTTNDCRNTQLRSQPTAKTSDLTAFSTESSVDSSVGMKRYFQDPSKPPRGNLDDSSESDEEPHISRRYLRRHRKREEELQSEILRWKHEAQCHAAVARQYRSKMKKMRTLAMAAIDRDDNIIELANADYERETVSDELVLSDEEDKKPTNQIHYSYIDNELFQNED